MATVRVAGCVFVVSASWSSGPSKQRRLIGSPSAASACSNTARAAGNRSARSLPMPANCEPWPVNRNARCMAADFRGPRAPRSRPYWPNDAARLCTRAERQRSGGRRSRRFEPVRAPGRRRARSVTRARAHGYGPQMTVRTTMREERIGAGYYVGHPAVGPALHRDAPLAPVLAALHAAGRFSPPNLFHDLDAARIVARSAPGAHAPQGLWLPQPGVGRLRREVADTPLAAILARAVTSPDDDIVAAGHDVVGCGGELGRSFVREDAGRELCRQRSLPLDPPPFLPDAATARRLAAALNADELGAPVLWVRCWRTVHAIPPH